MDTDGQCFATDETAKIQRALMDIDLSVDVDIHRRTFNWDSRLISQLHLKSKFNPCSALKDSHAHLSFS